MNYKIAGQLISSVVSCFTLVGCAAGGGMWMGSPQPSPVIASQVDLMNEPPTWPYKVVGYVQSQGTTLSTDVEVFRGLQSEAAKIGAPAVIVDRDFLDFSGTPSSGSFLGSVVKGTAIAPVALSPADMAKWRAARAPKKSAMLPAVQTIGP